MSSEFSYDAVVSHLGSQSDAIGRLAQDGGAFAAAVAAFESKDPDAFRWVLNHQEMLPYCELICHWVRVKMCVLRCFEVCGLPQEKVAEVNLQHFARAIVQLASNEKLLRRVVDAVSCGDGDDYRAAINELKLNDYCHLLCHWVCAIIYRRVCERVCAPIREPLADTASEIRAASRVFAKLVENEKALQEINKAALALDCGLLGSSIQSAGFGPWCETICCWICVWWCAYACREVCGVPDPIRIEVDEIEEARNFALASRKIAAQPRALGALVKAVRSRDAKAYGEIVARYGLGPYCYQLCAWVCSGICYEFCICVCPPPGLQPWFTKVGNFNIYTEIDPTSGRTNISLTPTLGMPYGGGPNFAFFGELQLGGYCPIYSPTFPGVQMQYRFLYATGTTTLSAGINAAQTTINVASSAGAPATPFDVAVCDCGSNGATGETMTVTSIAVTTWTVIRGQKGTTAAAAAVGATLLINPKPITGSLVNSPLKVGQRSISWPKGIAGVTQAFSVPTFEDVYVGYGTDPLPPPVGPGWYEPKHYIPPDPTTGWIPVDPTIFTGTGFQDLLNFDTTTVVPAACPPLPSPSANPCFGNPLLGDQGGAPAGSAVVGAGLGVGTDMAIIFQATRVMVSTIDYSNSLCEIRINNWSEVNNLWFHEFTVGGGCCQPIDTTLSVEFTVDHEEMDSGAWGLSILSCSGSAPGNITPPNPTAGVTFTAGGRGASGTIVENTTSWTNCSYQAWLTTRPGLTTGLADDQGHSNLLTFCICGHKS